MKTKPGARFTRAGVQAVNAQRVGGEWLFLHRTKHY